MWDGELLTFDCLQNPMPYQPQSFFRGSAADIFSFDHRLHPICFLISYPCSGCLQKIASHIIQKEGRYRTGDRDYLKELIKKPVKLRDLDIDTDITGENIESALK